MKNWRLYPTLGENEKYRRFAVKYKMKEYSLTGHRSPQLYESAKVAKNLLKSTPK